eukprot:TRINITY_DN11605_c0_g1_i1.p1 TRINITY_DN11605_c0_g1~~TRINITY_DN11605_c0_g1_i1.p1  ORF type:complete len:317 (-),score=98.29 TRINITY_DN11605_c0_g1_i1:33-983(-)
MMQDRLSEFMSGVKQSGMEPTPKRVLFNMPKDLELGFIKKKGSDLPSPVNDMSSFNVEVDTVRNLFTTMRANIDQVQSLYIKTIGSTSTDKASKTSAELDALLSSTNAMAKDAKTRLETMHATNVALQTVEPPVPPADLRIRQNQHGALTAKFQELVREYQDTQTNYKSKYEEKIKRQYKIARPDATEEEMDRAVHEEDASKVFMQELQGQPQAVIDAAEYIKERQRDIIRLEKSIHELHQLFMDMSVLVDSQGELINQIEYNVTASEVYIEQGNQQLEGALRRKRRHRKMMIALVILLLFLGAIITIPIVLAVKK